MSVPVPINGKFCQNVRQNDIKSRTCFPNSFYVANIALSPIPEHHSNNSYKDPYLSLL